MSFVDVNGARLFYRQAGEPGIMPAIVFTHGVYFDSSMFDSLFNVLSKRYHCVAFDWRSQGQSQDTLGGHDVDNLAVDALRVMDALNINKAHWVGVSIGGIVGIRLAAQSPKRIASLTMIGATAESESLEKLAKYEGLISAHRQATEVGTTEAIEQMLSTLCGLPFLSDPANKDMVDYAREKIATTNASAMAKAIVPIIRRTDIRHMLAKIRIPTLVLVGELDAANGPDKAKVLADGIAGARLRILRNVGHTPPLEAPDEVSSMIDSFLSSLCYASLKSESKA